MIQLTVSEDGELIIPKKILERLGLTKGKNVLLKIEDETIKIKTLEEDVVKTWEEKAKRYNLDLNKLVYGDKLYEEVF